MCFFDIHVNPGKDLINLTKKVKSRRTIIFITVPSCLKKFFLFEKCWKLINECTKHSVVRFKYRYEVYKSMKGNKMRQNVKF